MLSDSTNNFSHRFQVHLKPVAIALTLAVSLGLLYLHQPAKAQQAIPYYSCTIEHCYAITTWPGRIGGGFTQVDVVSLSSTADSGDFINNEIWVGDDQSSGCQGQHDCWGEIGYGTYTAPGNGLHQEYFYAYVPPNGSYQEVELGDIPNGDYGNKVTLRAFQQSDGYFLIGYSNLGGGNNFYIHMTLAPTDWDIGLELYGTSGSSAPTAHFTKNIYYDKDLSGRADFEQVGFAPTIDSPANAYWNTLPNQNNQGGDFVTNCGC